MGIDDSVGADRDMGANFSGWVDDGGGVDAFKAGGGIFCGSKEFDNLLKGGRGIVRDKIAFSLDEGRLWINANNPCLSCFQQGTVKGVCEK